MSSFVVTDGILGSDVLKQITSASTSANANVIRGRTSGGVDTSATYGGKAAPMTTLTSTDVAGMVGFNTSTFVTAGLAVLSGTITVPFKQRANAGTFASGSNHAQITGANALIVPTSFEATEDVDQNATGTCEVHWISSDGDTFPYTGSSSASIASEAYSALYTIGIADINGTDLATVVGIRVNPGLEIVKNHVGKNYPQEVSIGPKDPTIDITVEDLDEIATLTDGYTSLSSFECYFRKRGDGAQHVADGTAEHIKFSFADGILSPDSIEVSETGNGSGVVRLHGHTMTATATSAIT